jgi:hypothetical protein
MQNTGQWIEKWDKPTRDGDRLSLNGHEYRYNADVDRLIRVKSGTDTPEMMGGRWDMLSISR